LVSKTVDTIDFFAPIEGQLSSVEQMMRAQAEDRHIDLSNALDHLLSSGGKRIRPAISLLVGGMLAGDQNKLITLAAAIELLHTATLVHDDLIDGSLLRRGNATINSQWTPAATVLTGDFIFARAAKLAAKTDSVAVMQLFAETLAIIVNGEIGQLFDRQTQPGLVEYQKRIFSKTASMFELCTAASAMLSPVDDLVIDQMHQFGKNLGMAFQIVDDVLDYTGESSQVGKPVGSDLRQGIVTLPAILFHLDHPTDPAMSAVISGNDIRDSQLNELIANIKGSGAIEKSLEMANEYINISRRSLLDFPESIYKSSLLEILSYIIRRRV
jgi:geranylgeranyl pyrophosphate synthase